MTEPKYVEVKWAEDFPYKSDPICEIWRQEVENIINKEVDLSTLDRYLKGEDVWKNKLKSQ